jgi:hypothetical protein
MRESEPDINISLRGAMLPRGQRRKQRPVFGHVERPCLYLRHMQLHGRFPLTRRPSKIVVDPPKLVPLTHPKVILKFAVQGN